MSVKEPELETTYAELETALTELETALPEFELTFPWHGTSGCDVNGHRQDVPWHRAVTSTGVDTLDNGYERLDITEQSTTQSRLITVQCMASWSLQELPW